MKVSMEIRKKLNEKGLSYGDLAERIGKSKAYVGNIIKFGITSNVDALIDIAAALDIPDGKMKKLLLEDRQREASLEYDDALELRRNNK